MNDASSILASSMKNPTFSAISSVETLGKEYRERNFLNGFKKLCDSWSVTLRSCCKLDYVELFSPLFFLFEYWK